MKKIVILFPFLEEFYNKSFLKFIIFLHFSIMTKKLIILLKILHFLSFILL